MCLQSIRKKTNLFFNFIITGSGKTARHLQTWRERCQSHEQLFYFESRNRQDEVASPLQSKSRHTKISKPHSEESTQSVSLRSQKHQIMHASERGDHANCFFALKEDSWAQYLIHFTLPPLLPLFATPLTFSVQPLYFSLTSSK